MKSLVFAITGANGQLGFFLVNYLRSHGHIVYELVRSEEKAQDKNYYQFFDLTQPTKMPSLQKVDVLIHAAYFFDTTAKNYEEINIIGAQNLFQQAKIDDVKYSIFISTVSAYSAARSLYGRTKFQLEQRLMSENENVVTVRPGLIFHIPLQGITATMDNFIKKYPIVPLFGNGKQLIYPCFLEELAQLILLLSINQPKIKQPIVAATEQAITFKQLVQYLANKKQKKIRFLPIPFQGIYFALKMLEALGLSIGLRSDSLAGLHYSNSFMDFSATKNLGAHFSHLNI